MENKIVKVIHNFIGHEFKIGEEVLVIEKADDNISSREMWLCENLNKDRWCLSPEEFEILK